MVSGGGGEGLGLESTSKFRGNVTAYLSRTGFKVYFVTMIP